MSSIRDFIQPIANSSCSGFASWGSINESVMELLDLEDFPFCSLIYHIQKECCCRILIELTDEDDKGKLNAPVACFTSWEKLVPLENTLQDDEDRYLATHIILIDSKYFSQMSKAGLRLGVAHELGHIVLHLSQLDTDEKIERFHEEISDGSAVPYDSFHEMDATVFAVILCLFRNGDIIRKPSCIKEMQDVWINTKSTFPKELVLMVDEAFRQIIPYQEDINYPRHLTNQVKRAVNAEIKPNTRLEELLTELASEAVAVEENIQERSTRFLDILQRILAEVGAPDPGKSAEDAVAVFGKTVRKSLYFVTRAPEFDDGDNSEGSGI